MAGGRQTRSRAEVSPNPPPSLERSGASTRLDSTTMMRAERCAPVLSSADFIASRCLRLSPAEVHPVGREFLALGLTSDALRLLGAALEETGAMGSGAGGASLFTGLPQGFGRGRRGRSEIISHHPRSRLPQSFPLSDVPASHSGPLSVPGILIVRSAHGSHAFRPRPARAFPRPHRLSACYSRLRRHCM